MRRHRDDHHDDGSRSDDVGGVRRKMKACLVMGSVRKRLAPGGSLLVRGDRRCRDHCADVLP